MIGNKITSENYAANEGNNNPGGVDKAFAF